MADPLSITASLLAVITAAIKSTKSLYETVNRFKDRNKILPRLQNELQDLTNILNSLTQVIDTEQSALELLQGPIERCGQICREFERSMEVFSRKSKTGFRDWTKMEFMRGDMNEFIDTIAGYKSTISVGLGTITIRTTKISHKVIEEYNEMVQDTVYNLGLLLQRIDEKMTQLDIEHTNTCRESINLEDEREVTKQCLRICEEARSYMESLSDRESSILPESTQSAVEAQLRTRQTLDKNRDSIIETINHLQKRLEFLVQNDGPEKDNERSKLQADINISKQCLDVCNMANEVTRQKVYRIGEVVADGDSDQVVVNTLADLFDVKKAISKDNSAQLVGSMTPENLRYLTEKRYNSRFGALTTNLNTIETGIAISPPVVATKTSKCSSNSQTEESTGPKIRHNKPLSNEMRKRDGAMGKEKRGTTES